MEPGRTFCTFFLKYCCLERCRVVIAPGTKDPRNTPRNVPPNVPRDRIPRAVAGVVYPRGRRGLALAHPSHSFSCPHLSSEILSFPEISSLSGDCLHHHHFRYRCLEGRTALAVVLEIRTSHRSHSEQTLTSLFQLFGSSSSKLIFVQLIGPNFYEYTRFPFGVRQAPGGDARQQCADESVTTNPCSVYS